MVEKRCKFVKKWPRRSQDAPKVEPKSRKVHGIAQNGYQMAPKTPLPRRTRRFLAIFGYPLGAQKSPKIDFFPKKPCQGALFYRFLLRTSFSSIFWWIFGRFWMKNRWKKTCFFQAPLAFFPTWRPSRNTVFYDTKATFSFFEFLFFFFEKLMKKTIGKFTSQKSRKMTPGGTQNTPKILKKWPQNRQKSRKMPKKLIFWGVDFLMIFWMTKKSKKEGIPIIE